jgi:two-component system response regulator ChvI
MAAETTQPSTPSHAAPADRPRVAVVDDEEGLRSTLVLALEREGWRVDTFADGDAAWRAFEQELPDVAILDIRMPGMDGLELCRRLRQRSAPLPILFLSSRDEELDRVLGLELGADDYLCKPFSMRELIARVRVLLRRLRLLRESQTASQTASSEPLPGDGEETLRVGDLELDLLRYEARWKGRSLSLTITELLILRALAERPGHVKTREALIAAGYRHDAHVSERTVDTHIKRLRRKLQAVDPDFDRIVSAYGVGYRFT